MSCLIKMRSAQIAQFIETHKHTYTHGYFICTDIVLMIAIVWKLFMPQTCCQRDAKQNLINLSDESICKIIFVMIMPQRNIYFAIWPHAVMNQSLLT